NFVRERENNPFLIDFELLADRAKKVRQYSSKIEFVLSQGKEEFCKNPMYFDRARYFYFVVFDSLFDICKHMANRLGVKKLNHDCFSSLIEIGVLPKELLEVTSKMLNLKDKLSSSWEIKQEELYSSLSELLPHFEEVLKSHSHGLKKALIIQK
ncbi:MAG: HepT-like ribonuclease domain-containing protein, partial [Aquificaceae bacterium]